MVDGTFFSPKAPGPGGCSRRPVRPCAGRKSWAREGWQLGMLISCLRNGDVHEDMYIYIHTYIYIHIIHIYIYIFTYIYIYIYDVVFLGQKH